MNRTPSRNIASTARPNSKGSSKSDVPVFHIPHTPRFKQFHAGLPSSPIPSLPSLFSHSKPSLTTLPTASSDNLELLKLREEVKQLTTRIQTSLVNDLAQRDQIRELNLEITKVRCHARQLATQNRELLTQRKELEAKVRTLSAPTARPIMQTERSEIHDTGEEGGQGDDGELSEVSGMLNEMGGSIHSEGFIGSRAISGGETEKTRLPGSAHYSPKRQGQPKTEMENRDSPSKQRTTLPNQTVKSLLMARGKERLSKGLRC